MTRRPRVHAYAGPLVAAVLCIIAGPALAQAVTPVAADAAARAAVITEVDGIAPVALDAPSLPQRVVAIGAFFAFLAAGLVLASAVALWAIPSLSLHVLLRRVGLVGRRRAPPAARS